MTEARLYISFGIARSGSTAAFELARNTLTLAGRAQRTLPEALRHPGVDFNYSEAIAAEHLAAIGAGECLVIKTHGAPTPAIAAALRQGRAVGHVVLRDPRDAVLSLMTMAARSRRDGTGSFAEVGGFEQAVALIRDLWGRAAAWLALPGMRLLTHQRLLAEPAAVAEEIAAQAGLALPDEAKARLAGRPPQRTRSDHAAALSLEDQRFVLERLPELARLVDAPPPRADQPPLRRALRQVAEGFRAVAGVRGLRAQLRAQRHALADQAEMLDRLGQSLAALRRDLGAAPLPVAVRAPAPDPAGLAELRSMVADLWVRRFVAGSAYVGDGVVLTRLYDGPVILADGRSRELGAHLILEGKWETEYVQLFRSLVRPGDVVLDVGANHGIYAIYAAFAAGSTGYVYAFEPNPRLAELCRFSLLMNGLGGWSETREMALGARADRLVLALDPRSPGGGRLQNAGAPPVAPEQVTVQVGALDEPAAALRHAQINVVKMDVEGHEGCVYLGMRGLVARSPDLLIMTEFVPSFMTDREVDAAAFLAMAMEDGFALHRIGEGGRPRPTTVEAELADTQGVRNLLLSRGARRLP